MRMFQRKGQEPRPLTDDDVDGWLRAAGQRPKEKTIERMKAVLAARHPIVWVRVNGDIAVLKKTMEREGMNPEDLPWIL